MFYLVCVALLKLARVRLNSYVDIVVDLSLEENAINDAGAIEKMGYSKR
jgi:hypothetical protein